MLYVPEGHASQVLAPGEPAKVPVGQSRQSVERVLPLNNDAFPAGHGVQISVPRLFANVPGVQLGQLAVPDTAVAVPRLHMWQVLLDSTFW